MEVEMNGIDIDGENEKRQEVVSLDTTQMGRARDWIG
jgi:hypothetical protein